MKVRKRTVIFQDEQLEGVIDESVLMEIATDRTVKHLSIQLLSSFFYLNESTRLNQLLIKIKRKEMKSTFYHGGCCGRRRQ
jgi:hypothetical protein